MSDVCCLCSFAICTSNGSTDHACGVFGGPAHTLPLEWCLQKEVFTLKELEKMGAKKGVGKQCKAFMPSTHCVVMLTRATPTAHPSGSVCQGCAGDTARRRPARA